MPKGGGTRTVGDMDAAGNLEDIDEVDRVCFLHALSHSQHTPPHIEICLSTRI